VRPLIYPKLEDHMKMEVFIEGKCTDKNSFNFQIIKELLDNFEKSGILVDAKVYFE